MTKTICSSATTIYLPAGTYAAPIAAPVRETAIPSRNTPENQNNSRSTKRSSFPVAANRQPGHPLFGVPVAAIGRRDHEDDVLFELLDGSGRVAKVHLTWAGENERPPCPQATIYDDVAAWAESFKSRDDFEDMLTIAAQDTRVTPARVGRQLAQTVLHRFAPKKRRGYDAELDVESVTPQVPVLSEQAKRLLVEAAEDRRGVVLKLRRRSGLGIHTNGKNLAEDSPRDTARWERAIQELLNAGLLQNRGHKDEVFAVTDQGYRIADSLKEQMLATH